MIGVLTSFLSPAYAMALMGAMQLSLPLVQGKPIGPDTVMWLKMIIGFDVMYTAVSVMLVETVLVG